MLWLVWGMNTTYVCSLPMSSLPITLRLLAVLIALGTLGQIHYNFRRCHGSLYNRLVILWGKCLQSLGICIVRLVGAVLLRPAVEYQLAGMDGPQSVTARKE